MKFVLNKITISTLLLMILGISRGWAQFNPPNPDEPAIKYKIAVSSTPGDIAWLQGEGSYNDGQEVWISSSSYNENYQFQYWELDGVKYTESSGFYYKLSTRDVHFIAHYKYCPENPLDPNAVFMRKLILKSSPEGVATFNYDSGQKFELNSTPYICAYGNPGYKFLGWYIGSKLVSESMDFYFTVPDENVTLVAYYKFDPMSPNDPSNFYSTSCEVDITSTNTLKGEVQVEGLQNGRAVFGTHITAIASPINGNTFCGWYDGDSLISTDETFTILATSSYSKISMQAKFLYNPHTITYMLDNQLYATSVEEMGNNINLLPDVVKDGYSFSGWKNAPQQMPNRDVVINGFLTLSNIRLSSSDLSMEGGKQTRLKVYVGNNSIDELTDVTWAIDDLSIATISDNGIINSRKKGTTVISAKLKDNNEISACCTLNVLSDNNIVELPDIPFEFNYLAENYDTIDCSIPNDLNAILGDYNLRLSKNYPLYVNNDRLRISSICEGYIDRWDKESLESGEHFYRSGNDELTIICKVSPRFDKSSNMSDLINNRNGSNTNFSLRVGYRNSIYLATRNSYTNRFLEYPSADDQIFAIRVKNDNTVLIQNLTTGESKMLETNSWGAGNNAMKFFYNSSTQYFTGDYFWSYLSLNRLTDDELWSVVDHNEGTMIDAIPNVMFGDANCSGAVNVSDISTIVDYVFGKYPTLFNYKASDVNLTRSVNVADIAGVISVIYGDEIVRTKSRRINAKCDLSVDVISQTILPGEEADMYISISNPTVSISAAELNIQLPEGLKLVGAKLDPTRSENHEFRFGFVDGKYKLISYSLDNTPFNGVDGSVFVLKVKADENISKEDLEIGISDIVFSDNGNEIQMPPMTTSLTVGDATGIDGPDLDDCYLRAYDLLGHEVDVNKMETGVYIIRKFRENKVIKTYKVIR